MNGHLADGFDEAARGLWLSAVESFEAAASECPDDPAPVLAAAVCRLRLDEPEAALLLLETATPELGPEWRARHAWLCAVARAVSGDPFGAEQAARGVPEARRGRLLAALKLWNGDLEGGIALLLRPAPSE